MEKKRKFSRRKFLRMCAGAAVLVGGGWMLAGKKLADVGGSVIEASEVPGAKFIRQVVAGDNGTARTVMWQTEVENPNFSVVYRQEGSSDEQTATPTYEQFSDDGETNYIYTAELTQLTPDEEWEYRLVDADNKGPWHSLKTANNDKLYALVFPDSQSSDYTDWENVAQGAASRNPDAEFFINMGDLVDNGEDCSQWRAWFNSVEGIIDRIPVAPIMGNHETYSRAWSVREPVAYLHNFAVPENNSPGFGRYYYSFDYGPVHFVALNTIEYEIDDYASGDALLSEQQDWFYRDMQATDKPWKIVLMHRDVLAYRIKNRPDIPEGISEHGIAWMSLFERFNVDVVFSAHLHTYRNRGHLRNFEWAEDGPYYILTGVAGNVRYTDFWLDHSLDKKIAPQPETDNYLVLKIDGNKLHISCYLPDGTELDSVDLEH